MLNPQYYSAARKAAVKCQMIFADKFKNKQKRLYNIS